MKKLLLLITALAVSSMLTFSCTKEIDSRTTFTELGEPIYKDQTLYRAKLIPEKTYEDFHIRFYSETFDSTVITSQYEGFLELEMPKNFNEGYIIISTNNHSKIILEYDQEISELPENIRTTETGEELDLTINAENLLRITANVVDTNLVAMPFMNYFVIVQKEGSNTGPWGRSITNAKGEINFNIELNDVYEKVWLGITKPEDYCSEGVDRFMEIQSLEIVFDEIVFVEKPLEEFKINIIDTSICNKNLKFTSYFITQRNYSICNEDLGEYSVPWCHIHPSMEFPTLFACTFNSDYSSFDGVTYVDGIDPQTHNFNSCTPDGYFFEMTGPLGTRIFDNVKFDTISGLFQHPNFIYQDVEENDFLNQECLPSECAHGDNFKSFEEYRLIYELEPDWAFPDDIMMHNFIDSDTELVGVITNYRDTEFKVRYRVPKI